MAQNTYSIDPLACYFIDYAVKIRQGGKIKRTKHSYALSKQLILTAVNYMVSQDKEYKVDRELFEKLSVAEKSVLFEMMGCSLDTFCVEDEVKYHDKRRPVYSS